MTSLPLTVITGIREPKIRPLTMKWAFYLHAKQLYAAGEIDITAAKLLDKYQDDIRVNVRDITKSRFDKLWQAATIEKALSSLKEVRRYLEDIDKIYANLITTTYYNNYKINAPQNAAEAASCLGRPGDPSIGLRFVRGVDDLIYVESIKKRLAPAINAAARAGNFISLTDPHLSEEMKRTLAIYARGSLKEESQIVNVNHLRLIP